MTYVRHGFVVPMHVVLYPCHPQLFQGYWTGIAGVNLLSPMPIQRALEIAINSPTPLVVRAQPPPRPSTATPQSNAVQQHHLNNRYQHTPRDILGQRGFQGIAMPVERPSKRVAYPRRASLEGPPSLHYGGKKTAFPSKVPSTPAQRKSSIRCFDTTSLLGSGVGSIAEGPSEGARRRTHSALPAGYQAMADALHREQVAALRYYQRRGSTSRVVLG